jgi:hypothetical protein
MYTLAVHMICNFLVFCLKHIYWVNLGWLKAYHYLSSAINSRLILLL